MKKSCKQKVLLPGIEKVCTGNLSNFYEKLKSSLDKENYILVDYPKLHANTRQLCNNIENILTTDADIFILGFGLIDYCYNKNFNQGVVDIYDFSYRIDWLIYKILEIGKKVIFAFVPPIDFPILNINKNLLYDKAFSVKYLKAIEEVCNNYSIELINLADWENYSNDINCSKIIKAVYKTVKGFLCFEKYSKCSDAINSVPDSVFEGSELYNYKSIYDSFINKEYTLYRQKKIVSQLNKEKVERLLSVMFIGDSIRMRIVDTTGYVAYVYNHLNSYVNIYHVMSNCQGTKNCLNILDQLISNNPDIIIFNSGLHDIVRNANGGMSFSSTSIDIYKYNLEKMISIIKKSDVGKIFWCNTTPVYEEWCNTNVFNKTQNKNYYKNDLIMKYNEVANNIMEANSIEIIDFYSLIKKEGIENVLLSDGVHLNNKGIEVIGKTIVSAIIKYLERIR